MNCLTHAAARVFARTHDGHDILPAGDCACGHELGEFDVRFCDLCGAEGCSRCHVKNDIGETGWMCRACADDQVGPRPRNGDPHPQPLSRPAGEGGRRPGEGICDGCLVPGGCGCSERFSRGDADADILHSPFNIQHSGVRP